MGRWRLAGVFSAMVLCTVLVASRAYGEPPLEGLAAQLVSEVGGRLAYHDRTGHVRFYRAGEEVVLAAMDRPEGASGADSAVAAFLGTYGRLFGLRDPRNELALVETRLVEGGKSVTRYQQVHSGVPVLGGELVVQVVGGAVILASGEIAPTEGVSIEPSIPAAVAADSAIRAVAKAYGLPSAALLASEPELWVYSPQLLGWEGGVRLVWRVEVTGEAQAWLRELVLLDAHLGAVVLQFNQVDHAKSRLTYSAGRSSSLPGILARGEADGPAGDWDVDRAHEYAGDTYDFYYHYHGRDGIDGQGMDIVSTTHYYHSQVCPNAFWNGRQMVYCDGMVADDVVAHEMTHGLTQHTSNLFYYFQSGAINEGLSDIWGEFVDLTNGRGVNEGPAYRWLVGEDLPGGPVRSMAHPPAFGQPDRVLSPLYDCDEALEDQGGVHANSGVLNKAAYLITDGESFNGYSVRGIGLDKAAAVFYELQTNLLTSASEFRDLYDLLPAACRSLKGTAGIVEQDCIQVDKAVAATEMDCEPLSCAIAEPPVCDEGLVCADIFHDDFEDPESGNWQARRLRGVIGAWYYPQNTHPYVGWDATYATSGEHNLWGDDPDVLTDSVMEMTRDVRLPTGEAVYLHFRHAYDFEMGWLPRQYYDGGVIEFSTNGGITWEDVSALPGFSDYTGIIDAGGNSDNPLGGREAYVGRSYGYTASRLDLGSLGGQEVRFRFRLAADSSVGSYGWFIDDFRIYTCDAATVAPTPTVTPSATATVKPTATGTATPTQGLTVTPTPTDTLRPTATPTSTPSPAPTATATPAARYVPLVAGGPS